MITYGGHNHNRRPGDSHHLGELKLLEKFFYNALGYEKYLDGVYDYVNKNLYVEMYAPLTFGQIKAIDEFTAKHFEGIVASANLWIFRAYVVAALLSDRELAPGIKMPKVEILPRTFSGADPLRKFTEYDKKVFEFAKSDVARNITAASAETSKKVKEIIAESIKLGRTKREAIKELQKQFEGDESEVKRNWGNVAISAINEAFNKSYLAQIKTGGWVIGFSMPDACEQCVELISDKIFPVIDDPKLDYSNINPISNTYKKAQWLYDNAVWAEKDNWGRRRSSKKRIDVKVGNKKGNLVERPHHEQYVPALPLHPSCRCKYIRININEQYINKEGRIRFKHDNPQEYNEWFNKNVKSKIEGLKQYGK